MMDTKKNSRLQNTRLAAGLSQSQLAAATGLNVRTLQCYEQGAKDINNAKLATLLKLCLALDCKLGDILTDEATVKLLEQHMAA